MTHHRTTRVRNTRLDQQAPLAGLFLSVVLALCTAAALAWIVRDASQRSRRAARAGATTEANAILRDIFDVVMFRATRSLDVGFEEWRTASAMQGPAVLDELQRGFARLHSCRCAPDLEALSFFRWSADPSQPIETRGPHASIVQQQLLPSLRGLDSAALLLGEGYNVLPANVGGETKLWFLAARGDRGKNVHGAAAEVSMASVRERILEPAVQRVLRDRLPAGADTAFHFLLVGPSGDTLSGVAPPQDAIFARLGFWGRDLKFENPFGGGFAATLWTDARSLDLLGLESGIGRSERWAIPLLLVSIGLAGGALALLVRFRRYDHERSVFASAIAHDLRTPLTKILLYAEALAAPATGERTRAEAGGVIAREARRMILQVENALRFVAPRKSNAAFDPQSHAMGALVHDVVEDMRPLVEQRQMQITIQVDDRLRSSVDAAAVRQMITNLIDNAMRYGPAGQTIRVTVAADGTACLVAVADEGSGVPPEDRERVFTPFVRGAKSPTGTGLGLAIVRLLVQLHEDAEVSLHDAPGGGALFQLRFPLDAVPDTAP